MAVRSGYFNSVGGDRKYNADDMSMYFDKLISSGVYPNPSTNLQVVAATGMTVNVSPGRGIINCRWVNNDAAYPLEISQADAVLDRVDAVIMKLDLSENVRDIHFEVKKGTAASNPQPPEMTRDEYVQEYCLATVRVEKLAESVSQINITDTRANTNVCGWVTGLIQQVDTSSLFLQWQSAYEKWFSDMQELINTVIPIQQHTSRYTATQENETSIPININDFIPGVDILNVYISGLRVAKDAEYSIAPSGDSITLTQGVDKGTIIDFEVIRSLTSEA